MNPTHDHIRRLLDRYDAAETTLAEERELRRLLADPAAAAAFPAEAALFGAWVVLANATPAAPPEAPWLAPSDTGRREISAGRRSADAPGGRPTSSPGAPLAEAPTPAHRRAHRPSRRLRLRLTRFRLAAAAAVALFAAAALGLLLGDATPADAPVVAEVAAAPAVDWSRYEVTDSDEAARVTRIALAKVSTRLARGSRIASREVGRIEPIHHATTAF